MQGVHVLHGGLQVGAQDLGVEGVLLHRQGLVVKPLQLQQKLLLVGQRRPGGGQGWYSQIYCCTYLFCLPPLFPHRCQGILGAASTG